MVQMDSFNGLAVFIVLLTVAAHCLTFIRAEPINCTAVLDATDIRTNPLGCNFNSNTCGYKLSGLWMRNSTYSYHKVSIPSGLNKSPFVVCDRKVNAVQNPSLISSPELKPGTYCISFWVYNVGIYQDLDIKTSTGKNVTGELKGALNSGWIRQIFSVNESVPFQIEFQHVQHGIPFLTRYNTMGIDNIHIVPTSTSGITNTACAQGVGTPSVGTCDFKTDECGYSVQGRFTRHTGRFDYGGQVIPQGHENSPYIVCNWQKSGASVNNTLTSPEIEPGTYCMTFWHYITDTSVGLSVFTSTGTTLFANITDKESRHDWTQVSVSITEKKPFKVLFEMLRATGFFSSLQTIGIDDIQIASVQQEICTIVVPEGSCTFTNEKSCAFTLDVKGRWKINNGQFDLLTRPVISTGQDDWYYAVFESFQYINNETEGQHYDISSPLLHPGYYCLSFWYYMPNIHSNISIMISTGVHMDTLWTFEGSQKNWTEESLHIDQTGGSFKILFRSFHVSKNRGAFVGLDNIKLTQENILYTSTTLTSPTQSSSSSPVTLRPSEGRQAWKDICKLSSNNLVNLQGGCDFNNGSCGYTFPPYLWSIDTESNGMIIFGPTDNDIGLQQTFAVFQSNDPHVNMSTNVDITTTTISSVTSDVCLTLLILMPNQNSKLEIYLMTESNNQTQLISEYKQTLISQWKKIEIPINVNEPFKIIFRSEKENSYGYIGVDNIKIFREKLPTTAASPTTTPPTTNPTTTTTTQTSTMTFPSSKPTTTMTPTSTGTVPTITWSTRSYNYSTTPEPTTETFISTTPTTTTTTTTATTTTPIMTQSSTTLKPSTSTETSTTTAQITNQMVTCSCSCPTFQSKCAKTTSVPVTPIPQVCSIPEMDRVKQSHVSCNFDRDTCQYNVPAYPHLWEPASYTFGNKAIGEIPGDQSTDHSGGYMLFNTYNNHVQSNQTHYFQTPVLSPNVSYCLSFWYITPTNYSNLAVFVTYSDNSPIKLLWTTKHQARANWVHEYLGIREDQPFQLKFESIKESFFSFLGVDNVLISSAPSPSNTGSPTPLVTSDLTTKSSQVCNCSCPSIDCHPTTQAPFVAPPCGDLSSSTKLRDVSCDFDDRNTCGYNIPIYPHLWEIHRFAYGDVTLGTIDGDSSTDRDGSYLLFNTDNYHVQPGQIDDVTSPQILNQNKTCLSFQYNMPTEGATLAIYQNINGQKTMLWEQSNTTTNGWIQANVLIPAGPQYKIVLSSIKTGLDSYFGLDNIELFTDLVV